jgi:hypothetical protein
MRKDNKAVHVGFVVDKISVGSGVLRARRFSPFTIIPSTLYTHPLISNRRHMVYLAINDVVKQRRENNWKIATASNKRDEAETV